MATPRDVALANARALRKFMQGQGEAMSNLSEEYLTPLIDELLDGEEGEKGEELFPGVPMPKHVIPEKKGPGSLYAGQGVNPTLKYQVVSGGKASPSKGYSDSVSLNPVGEEWPDDDGEWPEHNPTMEAV